jgi:hypothetical protein
MIVVANYPTKKFRETVNQVVGNRFSMWERIKMGGIGSGQLKVLQHSEGLAPCFGKNHDTKFVIVEMRKSGIVVYVRNYIDNYVWLIPYYQLSIFKSDCYSLHANGNFIKINLACVVGNNAAVLNKIQQQKNDLTHQLAW